MIRILFLISIILMPGLVEANYIQKNNPTALIFISFSMPDETIVSYLKDAKRVNASVVIRGLINNSFKDTFFKVATLVKKSGVGGVELNPLLFKKFKIIKVPAVVVLASDQALSSTQNLSSDDFDVVYGNIPICNALKVIRDHGTISKNSAEKLYENCQDSFS